MSDEMRYFEEQMNRVDYNRAPVSRRVVIGGSALPVLPLTLNRLDKLIPIKDRMLALETDEPGAEAAMMRLQMRLLKIATCENWRDWRKFKNAFGRASRDEIEMAYYNVMDLWFPPGRGHGPNAVGDDAAAG